MFELTNTQIDADLRMSGYDNSETYPEYGHSDLRSAYRDGFDSGQQVHERILTMDELDALPERVALAFSDGQVRLTRREYGCLQLRSFDGCDDINLEVIEEMLPAIILYRCEVPE
jgi:hypothetical protein